MDNWTPNFLSGAAGKLARECPGSTWLLLGLKRGPDSWTTLPPAFLLLLFFVGWLVFLVFSPPAADASVVPASRFSPAISWSAVPGEFFFDRAPLRFNSSLLVPAEGLGR